MTARASVVIPAHDEERVIGRCLDALAADPVGELEVVVAANGCTDRTVDVARAHGARALDIATPGKANALNEGDAACTAMPRIYLDADIVLGPGALARLVEALDTDQAVVASPRVRFITEHSDRLVRAYYDVFRELPYVRSGLVGLGVYGMSAAGRARFDRFPDVLADDLFAQRMFAPDERVIVDGTFDVQAPRTVRDLLAVRVRIAKGNAELAATPDAGDGDFSASTGSTVTALRDLARRRPDLLPAIGVYLAVTVAARLKARRSSATAWERDTSTR